MENKRKSSGKRAVEKRCAPNLKSNKTKTINNDTNILSLNDDCLLSVFRFMGIRDVANAEQTCTRLREIANLYYRTMKILVWTPDLPFASASKIICKFGCFTTSLHSLRFDGVRKPKVGKVKERAAYQHFIDTLVENCKKIKSLTFNECDGGSEWAPFFDSLQYLESLSLFNTTLRKSDYMDRVITLKRFHLDGYNSFRSGKFNDFLSKNDLRRLVLEDCERLSRDVCYFGLADMSLESLSVEVYSDNVAEVEENYFSSDPESEMRHLFCKLKRLKVTQAKPKMNLNEFLKTIVENASLDELDLFKVNVNQDTFAIMETMKLKTLKLYPRIQGSASTFCHMLVDALANLKHLTLVLFDSDRDTDISDDDLLLLIERLRNLESLNLYHCECECGCDYVVCPFRCKLRCLIDNINKIFETDEQRPPLKLILPKRMSQSFFNGKKKLQKKYRGILNDRVQLMRPNDLDSIMSTTDVYSKSIFDDFLQSLTCGDNGEKSESDSTMTFDSNLDVSDADIDASSFGSDDNSENDSDAPSTESGDGEEESGSSECESDADEESGSSEPDADEESGSYESDDDEEFISSESESDDDEESGGSESESDDDDK